MKGQPDKPRASAPPTLLQLILFAFPALPHSFVALPLNIVIPAFFAAHTAVTLGQIAAVTSLSRILDAFLDPTIGYLSDRTRSRLGPRKPWVLAGTIVCAISIYFLFQPTPTSGFAYYGIWSFFLYFGFTLFEIPRAAWTAELSRDYVQRSKIATYVAVFNVAGSWVFWLMPLALVGITGTTAITGTALTGIAWLYVALMPAGILLAVLFVPSGAAMQERLATLGELWRSLRTNKPLGRFYCAYGAWGFGQGCYLSVIVIFLSDYMRLAAYFPVMMIMFFGVSMLAMPFWHFAIKRFGKHRVWTITMALEVMTRPLILFFHPGHSAIIPLFAITALGAVLNGPANIVPYAILGDVIDYDLLKSRVNKAGNIFSIMTLLIKATMAVGAGLAFGMLDFFHYRVGHANSAHANLGLILCYLLFPALMYFLCIAFAWNFPVDRRRHGIIRRRLERRVHAPL